MQNCKPLISVVIATYRRCDILKITLEKLSAQSVAPHDFEVIVVDDGSGDNTSEVVHSMMSVMPYTLKYLWHENRGPGYTENRGIEEARSDLLLLIADDIWATPELLAQHIKMHKDNADENIAVLGNVVQSLELPATVMHKNWDGFHFHKFKGMHEVPGIFFYACNISVKKDFLLENGMFRERKGAAHEDAELGYRLSRHGLKILHNENALAYHFHEESLDGCCRRAYERGLNFDMLSDNIPKPYVFPIYKIATLEAGLKAFLRILPREIIRRCVFNRWSIHKFWLPVLKKAETNRFAELFASSFTYRGATSFFLREGYKKLRASRRTLPKT